MYAIEFSIDALDDLKAFKKREQQQILDAIDEQLQHEPMVETRNRKRLRPNKLAEWEVRLGTIRVFYNIHEDERAVSIEAMGFKTGNVLFVRGERKDL